LGIKVAKNIQKVTKNIQKVAQMFEMCLNVHPNDSFVAINVTLKNILQFLD